MSRKWDRAGLRPPWPLTPHIALRCLARKPYKGGGPRLPGQYKGLCKTYYSDVSSLHLVALLTSKTQLCNVGIDNAGLCTVSTFRCYQKQNLSEEFNPFPKNSARAKSDPRIGFTLQSTAKGRKWINSTCQKLKP